MTERSEPGRVKQRVVGILVLGALAAIFLPMVFEFGGRHRVDTRSQIPPAPDIAPVVIPEPAQVEGLDAGKTDRDIFQFDASREAAQATAPPAGTTATAPPTAAKPAAPPKPAASAAPTLDERGIPNAWVLQVASFKEEARARDIVDKLLADGYKAFIRSATTADGVAHRVYVGPKLDRQKLHKEKAMIESKYRVKALELKFEP